MNRIIVCLFLLIALLFGGCSEQQKATVDYSRLPVGEYSITFYNPEAHWQLIYDTPQSRYIAHIIELSLVPNGIGNITGDFTGIENATMYKLVKQAIFHTPAIDLTYYSDVQENYVQNNIVSIVFSEAIKDGRALGEVYYADDIEQTLIYLYGDYPEEGKSYRDYFSSVDNIEFYREEGLFLQRFDWGIVSSAAQVLALQETAAAIVCDFVTVTCSMTGDGYEVEYEVELTADNFVEQTVGLDVLRFTYHYAEDDGRPILYSVETLGKLGSLLHLYGLEGAAGAAGEEFDLGITELLKDYIAGIEQKDIGLLKPLFTEACAFRENAPVSGTDIANYVMRSVYNNEPAMFEEAKRLYGDIADDLHCTFVEFFFGSGDLRYHFLFRDNVEYEYKETRFLDYDDNKGNIYRTVVFICHDDSEVDGWLFHHLSIANINGSYKIMYAVTDI